MIGYKVHKPSHKLCLITQMCNRVKRRYGMVFIEVKKMKIGYARVSTEDGEPDWVIGKGILPIHEYLEISSRGWARKSSSKSESEVREQTRFLSQYIL